MIPSPSLPREARLLQILGSRRHRTSREKSRDPVVLSGALDGFCRRRLVYCKCMSEPRDVEHKVSGKYVRNLECSARATSLMSMAKSLSNNCRWHRVINTHWSLLSAISVLESIYLESFTCTGVAGFHPRSDWLQLADIRWLTDVFIWKAEAERKRHSAGQASQPVRFPGRFHLSRRSRSAGRSHSRHLHLYNRRFKVNFDQCCGLQDASRDNKGSVSDQIVESLISGKPSRCATALVTNKWLAPEWNDRLPASDAAEVPKLGISLFWPVTDLSTSRRV